MRILSVRLSVRLSVKRVLCDKMEETSIQIITALHVMQTRYRPSDENSVRPSHAWIVTKWKKDLSRFLYLTKDKLA